MSIALNAAIDAVNAAAANATEEQQLIVAKCRALLVGYDARWQNAGWQTVSVEEVFHLPLINPATGAQSKSFTLAGKFDGIVAHEGRLYLLEHKTCSEDITDPNASYWRRMAIDSQVSCYMLANWQSERKLHGTLYDVIRKPAIRPKKISKAEQQTIISFQEYCRSKVSSRVQVAVAEGQDHECPELFEKRLTLDVLDRPDWYFQRRTIPRMDSEIVEYATELWDVSQSILEARRRNAHYRNSDACMNYGSPCSYLGICSGYDTPDSDNWQTSASVHGELPVLGNDRGLSVLTNSRVRCFQTCRRKHYFRYELGIQRRDEEERESLWFGSLIHVGLEAWFSCFMERND